MTPSVDGLVGAGLVDVGARHVGEGEPAAEPQLDAPERAGEQLQLRCLHRLEDVLEDLLRPHADLDQLRGRPERAGVGVGVLEAPRVGHEADVERRRDRRRQRHVQPGQQLAHHHRRARRAVVDEVDVAEARVVVVVVEVDHEVGALAHAVRRRDAGGRAAVDGEQQPAGAVRDGGREAVVVQPPVLARQVAGARTPTTSRPAARSPRTAPTSEPRASPSGFSCVATTTRGAARSAAAAASYAASSRSLTRDPRPADRRAAARPAGARPAAARCGCCARASRRGGTAARASGAGASRR